MWIWLPIKWFPGGPGEGGLYIFSNRHLSEKVGALNELLMA